MTRRLWALVMVGFTGDLLTTVIGLNMGLVERNPIGLAMMHEVGVLTGIVALKFSVLVVVAAISYLGPLNRIPPAILGTIWTGVTVYNAVLLAQTA